MLLRQDVQELLQKLTLPGELDSVVSLFDGVGQIWHIADLLGVKIKNRFSAEANPSKQFLLAKAFGYRNPPEWLAEKFPPKPDGLINIGGIYADGTFNWEGERLPLDQIAKKLGTRIDALVGGPTCKAKSRLNTTITNKEDPTTVSNAAADVATIVTHSAFKNNPDLKVMIENVANIGDTQKQYYNSVLANLLQVPDADVTDFGKRYNTGPNDPVNSDRNFWLSHVQHPAILDYLDINKPKNTGALQHDYIQREGYRPITHVLGRPVGHRGMNRSTITRSFLNKRDTGGLLAKEDPEGAYTVVERAPGSLTPAIIKEKLNELRTKKRGEKVTDSVYNSLEDYNDALMIAKRIGRNMAPDYWPKEDTTVDRKGQRKKLEYANFDPAYLNMQPGKRYNLQQITGSESAAAMGLPIDPLLSDEESAYLQAHPEAYAFARTNFPFAFRKDPKTGVVIDSPKGGQTLAHLAAGDSWHLIQSLLHFAGLLNSTERSKKGYSYGGYVGKQVPINKNLLSGIKY